ncbi:MAG: hypothetical protein ACXWQR_12625 [Ktedonobacterales bacterium]|jgi:hypothetical protein
MPRFFRIQVDEPALTDALFRFVLDPTPARNERPVIHELHEINPEMVSVLENMVIDGVNQRRYVEDYVVAALGEMLG